MFNSYVSQSQKILLILEYTKYIFMMNDNYHYFHLLFPYPFYIFSSARFTWGIDAQVLLLLGFPRHYQTNN